MDDSQYSPPPAPRRRAPTIVLGVLAGAAAGIVIAWAAGANATSTTSGSGQASQPPGQYAANPTAAPPARDHDHHGYHVPRNSGTVTAVGTNSVTIKTGTATTTYGVTADSDIDKNGEAKLGDLKVGDAVTFDTQTVNGKTVIDHLHAGDEAKDRPAGH